MKKVTQLLWALACLVTTTAIAQTPIAHYPFNGNANDAVGSNHGTVNGAVLTTDRFGNANSAYSFDGVDDNVDLGASNSIRPTAQLTLSAWYNAVNIAGALDGRQILSCTEAGGYQLSYEEGLGAFVFKVRRNGSFGVAQIPIAAYQSGWHNITGTYDGRFAKLFLDGVLVSTNDAGASFPIEYNNSVNTYIGAEPTAGFAIDPAYYWQGLIDEVKIYNTALTGAQVLAEFNATAISFANSMHTDGATTFASTPNGMMHGLTTFTYETWIKTTENKTHGDYWQKPTIIGNARGSVPDGDFGITTNNGMLGMWSGIGVENTLQTTVSINDNQWHHIAAVKNGATLTLYSDGVNIGSIAVGAGSGPQTTDAPLTIGGRSSNGSFGVGQNAVLISAFHQGEFAETRFSNTARYTANFTPANSFTTDANTVALYQFGACQREICTDASSNANYLRGRFSAPTCATGLPFTNAITYNGVDQSAFLPTGVMNGLTSFTIEGWIKSTDVATSPSSEMWRAPWIFGKEMPSANSGDIMITTQAGYANFSEEFVGGGAYTETLTKYFISDNQWHHVAVSADGTTCRYFIDGILLGSKPIASGLQVSASDKFSLMNRTGTNESSHSGLLEEVRFSNSARYTGNFTPPAGIFTTDANTVALYHSDDCPANMLTDASANNNHAALQNFSGNCQSVASQKPGSGNALSFDGSNDHVSVPNSASIQTGLFVTAECWAKSTTATWNDFGFLVNKRDSYMIHPRQGVKTIDFYIYTSNGVAASQFIPDASFDLTQWHHYAGTYDGNTGQINFYIDGILVDQEVLVGGGSLAVNSNPLTIGLDPCCGNRFFNGQMDEVKVWNTALSEAQLRDRMCRKITSADPLYANLAAYYNFDESTGSTAFDGSANANNGSLVNGPIRVTSGAAIGDSSAHNYVTTGLPAANLSINAQDNLGVAYTAGTFTGTAGTHIYAVDEVPNTTNGIANPGTNDRYFGVFNANLSSPSYTATYNYNGNAFVTVGNEAKLGLFKRNDNAATAWSLTPANLDANVNTLTATGQSTEYVLGEIANNQVLAPGSGNAISFDGINDHLFSALNINANAIPDLSISLWVKRTSSGVFQSIINNDNGGFDRGIVIEPNNTYEIYSGNGISTGVTSALNTWEHIVVSWSGNQVTLFKNGIQVFSSTQGSPSSGSTSLFIGRTSVATLPFGGEVDEVTVWNTVLTEAQIRDRMCRKITTGDALYANLVAYYNFDESTGTTAFDGSASGNNGNLVNGPTRVTSGAAIGNTSAHNYVTTGLPSANLSINAQDNLAVAYTSGTFTGEAGTHIYAVNEVPNTTNGIAGVGTNDRYFGVFNANLSSPSYTATYNYNGNPFVTVGNEARLGLFKRNDNAATAWSLTPANLDANANTLTATGQSTEYMLGEIANNQVLAPGSGNALSFDGADDHITTGAYLVPTSGDFTTELWVFNRNNTSGFREFISQGASGDAFYMGTTSGTGIIRLGDTWQSTGVVMPLNQWVHLAVVKSGTNGTFYLNGVQMATNSNYTTSAAGTHTLIGRQYGGLSEYPDANLDEIRVWNTALTQAQIRDRMCRKITSADPLYANLAAYFNFDESTGTTAFDGSASGNNGTLVNGPTRVSSGAAIGNTSAHNYVTTGLPSANLSINAQDNLGVAYTAGTFSGEAGTHIYAVTEAPNTTNGLGDIDTNSRYFGVYNANLTSPEYTATYNYSGNPMAAVANESLLKLYKRASNAGTTWAATTAAQNLGANTLSLTGQSTEYILAADTCPNIATSFSATACQSYVWGDSTYTTSGAKVQTLANVNGCDSVVTLNLTITPPLTWYLDADADGHYTQLQTTCTTPGTGWTSTLPAGGFGDCDDNNNLLFNGPTNQTVVLRSGNGNIGQPDAQIKMLVGPAENEFLAAFTPADFTAARAGSAPQIIANNPAWIASLPADPQAKWINDVGSNGSGSTMLLAYDFMVNGPVDSAYFNLLFAVDNALGGSNNQGVFINGLPISGNSTGGTFGGQFQITRNNIASMLQPGLNTLYINSTDQGGPGGIVFSATLVLRGGLVYVDADNDGYDAGIASICYGATLPAGYKLATSGPDCDDNDVLANTASLWYLDADNDSHYLKDTLACGTPGLGWTSTLPAGGLGDCDDANVLIWQTGQFFVDADGDGYGASATAVSVCYGATTPAGHAVTSLGLDCDDNNILIYQIGQFFVDVDGDGYGASATAVPVCYGASTPAGHAVTSLGLDCDDNNILIYQIGQFFVDADGDGYGASATTVPVCYGATTPAGHAVTSLGLDCDDNNISIYQIGQFFVDVDGDGYGASATAVPVCYGATTPAGHTATSLGLDCDDNNILVFQIGQFFVDVDGDGYSPSTSTTPLCYGLTLPAGKSLTSLGADCNDNNPTINAGAQRLEFSGGTNFASSIIYPQQGTSYTNFQFEVTYFDANGALPPPTYPRVYLDFEGNGVYNNANDRAIIMTPFDAGDLNTADGKRYIGTINTLPNGTNWETSIQVTAGSCLTKLGAFNYPDVLVLPDLQIFANNITFSSQNPPVSSPLTINALITNVSDYAAQNFVVHLLNEYDTTIVYPDIIVSNLAAHSSTTVTWNITTPALPAWCPMRVFVDNTNVIAESNELDNNAVRPFTNGNFSVPGTIVTTGSVVPPVSFSSVGNVLSLTGTAFYSGVAVPMPDTSAAGAEVNFTIVETGANFIGYTDAQGNFNLPFTAPLGAGTYTITGYITDFTLTGFLPNGISFTILPVCKPDLTAALTFSSYSIIQGQSVTGSVTVTNAGCASSAASVLTISQSGGSPTLTNINVPSLAPGASFTTSLGSITFALPGSFGFCATADGDFVIDEANESNNISCQSILVLPALPEIFVQRGPSPVLFNCTGTVPLYAEVANTGGAATGNFNCQVRVKQGLAIVQTFSVPVSSIASQSATSFSVNFNVPSNGSYTVEIICDNTNVVTEVNENNNTSEFAVDILLCQPDLTVGECEFVDATSANTSYTGTMDLNATIFNQGNAVATGPINVKFELSNGTSYTTQILGNLAPGASALATVNVPAFISTSTTLTVIADYTNSIAELQEFNNQSVAKRTSWEFYPVANFYPCGTNFWDVQYLANQAIYLSAAYRAEELYDADTLDIKFEVSGPGIVGTINLGNAQGYNVEQSCGTCPWVAVLPNNFVFGQVGTYTFTMTVDPDNKYAETNEGNNVMVVNVVVTDLPDMRTLSQFINPSALNPLAGQNVNFTVTYENIGASNITDQMKFKLLVDNVPVDSIYPVLGLVTNDNATYNFSIPWSSNIPGAHIIRAIIDSDDDVLEQTNANNEATRAIVVGDAANLFFDLLTSPTLNPNMGDPMQINAKVKNDGALASTADIKFYYVDNFLNEVLIDTRSVTVGGNDDTTFSVPWNVLDNKTTIIGRIVNSTALEFNYDDNEASFAIGAMDLFMQANAACDPGNLGSITTIVTGGTPPYNYTWSNGSGSSTLVDVAGTYNLVVTDNTGQSISGSATIVSCPVNCVTDSTSFTQSACGSYVWNGQTYTASGQYVQDLQNVGGCDSVVTLDLTISPLTGSSLVASGCDSYTWSANGQTYFASGTYTHAVGCNTDTLQLTISNSTLYFVDADLDGYGSSDFQFICSLTPPTGFSLNNTDCNDTNANINPGATEICNGIDDNCDGSIDEGVKTAYYVDFDGDGFGYQFAPTYACTQPAGYVSNNTDCDDFDSLQYPGQTWYRDADNDGYSDGFSIISCGRPSGWKLLSELVSAAIDCDDFAASIHPGAIEICNGLDDNCDGQIDVGVTFLTYYEDADNDGYGNAAISQVACSTPQNFVLDNTDCDDANPGIHAPILYYIDADFDGFGSTATQLICALNPPFGYSTNNTDCDDANPNIQTPLFYFVDADLDGFGSTTTQLVCAQTPPAGFATNSSDCDDNDATKNTTFSFYYDFDGDGFGAGSLTSGICAANANTPPLGFATNNADCNDANNTIYPGATEICGNGIDEDCNGSDLPCGGGNCNATVTLTSGGLNALWVNAGASAPNTFYYGVTDALRMNTKILGGVGPFTYAWSNSGGTNFLLPRANYPANSIDLYRPTGATTVTCTVTDQGTGCVYTVSLYMNWDNQFFCQVLNNTWYLNMCINGQNTCMPWTSARTVLRNNTGTMGSCIPAKVAGISNLALHVELFPNPNNGEFMLSVANAAGDLSLSLTDVNGKVLLDEKATSTEGQYYRTFDLRHLPPGMYFILVNDGQNLLTEKVVIRH